jgi:hypothetical protein
MKSLLASILLVSTVVFADTKMPTPQEGVDALKEEMAKLGTTIKVEGTSIVAGKKVPALYFDKNRINLNYKAVDAVFEKYGKDPRVTATVFVKDGDNYVRVSTNVKKDDNTRAIGTELAKNDAYAAIQKGEKFCGKVTILEKPYDTCYDPIKVDGKVVGIYYFGIKQ